MTTLAKEIHNFHLMFARILLFVFTLYSLALFAQQNQTDVCLNEDEIRLAELINNFRKENKLPPVALSVSLTQVAKTHVYDLQTNNPDTSICSTASWSNKGSWKACCYNPYVLHEECMWDKPKELTSYVYRGYELSYYEERIIQVDSLFALWKTTNEASEMLLTKGAYHDKKWEAMGLAIGENYACVWFGQRIDSKGKPPSCADLAKTQLKINATSLVSTQSNDSKYYLIYGSFSNRNDADEAVRRYRNNGFKQAMVLEKASKIRVAIGVYDNLKDAMAAKEKLAPSFNDAWILKN